MEDYSQWSELAAQSNQPMVLASFAALFASIFLGRWSAVAGRLTKLQTERLSILKLADLEGPDINRRTLYEILDLDADRAFRELKLVRSGVLVFAIAIVLAIIVSFLNGLSVFNPVFLHIARPFAMLVVVLIMFGLAFGIIEALSFITPQQRREQAVYALEKNGIRVSDDVSESIKFLLKSVQREFSSKSYRKLGLKVIDDSESLWKAKKPKKVKKNARKKKKYDPDENSNGGSVVSREKPARKNISERNSSEENEERSKKVDETNSSTVTEEST